MMTFAEADAQYTLVKQRYQAGALTDEQYDSQLRELMVLDDLGRWWAKSRESGVWHYYDTAAENWLPDAPPADKPAQAAIPPTAASSLTPASSSAGASLRPDAANSDLPKWAAVAPGATSGASALSTTASEVDRGAQSPAPASATANKDAVYDFGPLPELNGSLKIIFYVLSLLVPVLGFVLFLIYRNKLAPADRSAARVFLILGVVSLVFFCLGSVAILLLEAVILGAS